MTDQPAIIDHLVLATPDLGATVERLAGGLGVRATPGGRHPGLGTRNALLGLGGVAYLEIIAVDPEAPGPPEGPRPFGLDRIAEPRLAAWAARVDDIDRRVAAARVAGYDAGPVRPMSRRLPDGTELHWGSNWRWRPPLVPNWPRSSTARAARSNFAEPAAGRLRRNKHLRCAVD